MGKWEDCENKSFFNCFFFFLICLSNNVNVWVSMCSFESYIINFPHTNCVCICKFMHICIFKYIYFSSLHFFSPSICLSLSFSLHVCVKNGTNAGKYSSTLRGRHKERKSEFFWRQWNEKQMEALIMKKKRCSLNLFIYFFFFIEAVYYHLTFK